MSDTAGHLLELVRSGRARTRSELQRLTGLSRTAVVSRIDALAGAGLVLAGQELASTGGRRPGGLILNKDAGVVLAAAIGRSRSQLGVFDLLGTELDAGSFDHELGADHGEVLPAVIERLQSLLGASGRPLLGVGVSLPGAIDTDRGVSVDSPVLPAWAGVDLAPYFEVLGDAPVYVGNDADVLARSERMGHAAVYDDLIVIKASTGLGLGIIAEGRVISGHLGAAGEIGHTKVEPAGGLPCRCGDHGCLETVAGGWALVKRVVEAGRPIQHVRELTAMALAGDPEAKHLLRESGRRLGEPLAIAINLLNPQAVVIGGDMAAAFDVYSAGVRESVYARASAIATRELRIVPSTFGDRAGLVGCAAMALDQVLSPTAVQERLDRGQLND